VSDGLFLEPLEQGRKGSVNLMHKKYHTGDTTIKCPGPARWHSMNYSNTFVPAR
jgi:hypothetical protein